MGFAWSNRGQKIWRRLKEFGPREVFGARYHELTPLHEEFMTHAEIAEHRYREQEMKRQRKSA